MENTNITAVVAGILMMLILKNVVQCTLVIKPIDAAVKIGDFVTMRCSSSFVNDTCGQIAWKYFKPNSKSGDYINTDDQLSSSFASYISIINSRAGHCDLRINATPSAAGHYECFDGTTGDASAALIVLENAPEVKIVNQSHGTIVTALECSVKYYGNWAPKVQWVKIVGDSWTNVTATEREIIKNPVLSLIQFSSVIQIPTDNATEHFICNVTISDYRRPNTSIPVGKSLECGAERNKIKAYNEDFGQGIGIGFGIGFVICLCLCGIIFLILWYCGIIFLKERGTREEGTNQSVPVSELQSTNMR